MFEPSCHKLSLLVPGSCLSTTKHTKREVATEGGVAVVKHLHLASVKVEEKRKEHSKECTGPDLLNRRVARSTVCIPRTTFLPVNANGGKHTPSLKLYSKGSDSAQTKQEMIEQRTLLQQSPYRGCDGRRVQPQQL